MKGKGWEFLSFLGGLGVTFVTCHFGLLYEKSSLVWLASRCGRLQPVFPREATLTPAYVKEGNWFGLWEILNFSFGLVFWHTRRRHRMVYWYIDEVMWGWSMGRGWQLPTFWFCFLFINLCRVKSVCFVRILDVHHFNCNVLLCPLSTDIVLVISHCCFHCYFVTICTVCSINIQWVIWIYACCKELYAHCFPQESVVRGSTAQMVHGNLRVQAPGFQSSASPLLGATLRAQLLLWVNLPCTGN